MYLSNKNTKINLNLYIQSYIYMYNLLSANEHISICINVSGINIDQRERIESNIKWKISKYDT